MGRAGIAVAAAAMAVVVNTGVASAADGYVAVTDGSGHAYWVENGDTLYVCDDRPDNWGVRGYVYRPYAGDPKNGEVLIKDNDPSYDGNCSSLSKNIDESISISLKVCNYQGASVIFCEYTRLR